MPDDPQPNWRDSGSQPTSAGASRPWQPRESAAPAVTPASKRNLKRGLAVGGLLLIAAGFGAVIVWLRPMQPACLALVGSGYEQNLLFAHNVHGWNGLASLDKAVAQEEDTRDVFRFPWDQPGHVRRVSAPVELREQPWKEAWDKLDIASFKEKTLVLFVSMHGMADAEEAYLLPNSPARPTLKGFEPVRIPFRQVLDSLRALKKKHIVLLLDVSQAEAQWPIGMLHNDFVARLQEKYEGEIKEMGNLVVICSAAPDQRSWASDELQNTVFGHYVAQCLQGAGQSVHERVSAWKLFKFVEDRVDKWVQTNRARRQTPVLLGEESLAREVEIVHIAEPFVEPEAPAPRTFDPESMRAEWSKWRELRREQYPHVYCPHWWRLYQDTLVRCEELQRAGDPTGKAGDLKKTLARLHADITAARPIDRTFAALGNSLPMSRFLGYTPAADLNSQAMGDFLTNLRKADSSAERLKLMERFRDRSARDKQFLLDELSQLILQDIGALPRPARVLEEERLAELQRELRVPLLPAEAQFLKLLQDADPALDNETIRLALRTRVLAEAAALGSGTKGQGVHYGEAILPWTRKLMASADQLSREGEDWLFGDPKVDAVKARKKLQEAHDQYEQAQTIAGKVAHAMALRDTIGAELPYYAAWLAAMPRTARHQQEGLHALRVAVENVAAGLANLNRALDVERKVPADADLDPLVADATQLQSALQTVGEKLRKGAVLQQNWHTIDALLRVPPAAAREDDVDLRIALLARQRFISSELLRSTDLEGKAEDEELVRTRVDRQRQLLRACAQPVEEIRGHDRGNLDNATRDFFLKAPQEIVRKSTGLIDDDAEPGLVEAANLCRAIPAFAANLVRNDKSEPINPVDRLRRLRTHRLMLWLAQRSWEDHWFEPGPGRVSYYIPAAKAYLDTARGLFEPDQLSKAFVRAEEEMQKKLVPAGLAVTKEADPYWTTEFSFPLAWQVAAEGNLPHGTPTVWLEARKGEKASGLTQIGPRKAVAPWPTAQTPFAEPFFLQGKDFRVEEGVTARFHTLYRGEHRVYELPLLRGQPSVIVRNFPAPDKAGLAVRMDSAFDYGAISIVIDNSGSMNYVYPALDEKDKARRADRKKGEKRRFDFALDALGHVLRKIPENTYLSISTLGRKEGKEYISAPTEYRPPMPWRLKELDNLLADLSEAPGDIASPIADGIVRAMAEGFPPNFKGPRVLLVLTDGDDNYSFGSSYDPKNELSVAGHTATVVAGLRKAAAANPDVLVYVVCFIQKDDPDYLRAEAQFKGVAEFEVPGRFQVVPEGQRLGITIEDLIRPRLELRLEGRTVQGLAEGLPVNYPADLALNWIDVRPNTFRARLRRALGSDVAVELPPGNNLFAVLKRKERDLYLERGILGRQHEITDNKAMPPPRAKDGWLVSLVENHSSLSNTLGQLLVLEKMEVERNMLRQWHPGFTWLELSGADGKRPDQTVTWGRDWNLPAAAFRVETPDWPIKRASKTTVWYWPEPRDELLTHEKLYGRASVPVGQIKSRVPSGRLSADPVIDAALWEERDIAAPGGSRVKEKCLVIRVRHAKDRPVFIALDPERTAVGSEHHYFPGAGRYTAIFYNLDKLEIAHLLVFDVEAFKDAAPHLDFAPEDRYRVPAMFVNRLELP
jgi:hypothetical protein